MPAGLHLIDRNGYWHLHGTLRLTGRSYRVRRSLGLPARPDTREDAEALRARCEQELRAEVIHGKRPSHPLSLAARDWLSRRRTRPVGWREAKVVKDAVARFGTRILSEIGPAEWVRLVEDANAGNTAETRERYLNALVAFLNWCRQEPRRWIEELPPFTRSREARNPRTRARRPVQDVDPELLTVFIEKACPLWLGAQLAVEWSTGARVSSVLHGCHLSDLILAEGREQITFHRTKAGNTVTASLHPWTVDILKRYVKWRGKLHERDKPLFLTRLRKPYKENGHSGQNRSAFNLAKRRMLDALEPPANLSDLRRRRLEPLMQAVADWSEERRQMAAGLVKRFTQHWFRHLLATHLLMQGDLDAAMRQGGWLDPRSVLGYKLDVEAHRRALVANLPIGSTKSAGKSGAEAG